MWLFNTKSFINNRANEAFDKFKVLFFYLYITFLTAVITSLWSGNHSANNTGE